MDPDFISSCFIAIFFAILFLQSGIDKILDFDGNLKFLKTHFINTAFKNQVKLLLIIITFLEVNENISIFCFLIDL